jgi:hypothetical protein
LRDELRLLQTGAACAQTSATPASSTRGQRVHEGADDDGVELRAGAQGQLLHGLLHRHGRPVGAVRDHRVIRVADGDDPRPERDSGTGEPVRIAIAVEPLV